METDNGLEEKNKLDEELLDAIERNDLNRVLRCIGLKADVICSRDRKLNG